MYIMVYNFCLEASTFDEDNLGSNIWREGGKFATIAQFENVINFSQKSVKDAMEKVHGLNGYRIRKLSDHDFGSDKKNILVLPYSLPHLRETLNYMFLLASEDRYLSILSNGSVSDKIDWVTKIRRQVNANHPDSFTDDQCNPEKVFQGVKGRLGRSKQISIDIDDEVTKLLKDASYYQLLRYIRSFNEIDRVSYSHINNTIGVIHSGYLEHHGKAFVSADNKKRRDKCNFDFDDSGKICGYKEWNLKDMYGPGRKYMDLVDVDSRMVVDFSKIDKKIAIPVTNKMTPVFESWQDSAAIRFFIGDKTYDVYFPTRWSNLHYDISNVQTTTYSEFERSFNLGTEDLNEHLIETQDKIRFFRHSDGELNYFNYGYYPMQTPRIVKAFEQTPLHAIWSVNLGIRTRYSDNPLRRGHEEGRTKIIYKYETLQEAIEDFGHSTKFELVWDNRFSFFPEEFVSELRYMGRVEASRMNNSKARDRINWIDQSFSNIVPFYGLDEVGIFSQMLQKSVDNVTHPFVWEKYRGTDGLLNDLGTGDRQLLVGESESESESDKKNDNETDEGFREFLNNMDKERSKSVFDKMSEEKNYLLFGLAVGSVLSLKLYNYLSGQ